MSVKFKIPIFEVTALDFEVQNQKILDSVSLKIFAGEYDAIIGPNGGGKTTFIRMLLKLQTPTSGSIKIFGQDINKFKGWNKIGYVPQRTVLLDATFPATVFDIVKMGRTSKSGFFRRYNKKDLKYVYDAMKKMDILDLKDKMIGSLSGGQRQRVMIARALSSNPTVLILDEPNTGVDVKSQHLFYELLRDLNKNENITILFITHDVGVIIDDVKRVLTINTKLLTCNNPKESISCENMSELYATNAHLLFNHHVH